MESCEGDHSQNKTFKGLKREKKRRLKPSSIRQNKTFKGLKQGNNESIYGSNERQNKTFKGLKHGFTIWVNRDLFLDRPSCNNSGLMRSPSGSIGIYS